MAARLKVFSWSNGFHAFTVAASSREKALAAWGIEQDIFKDGLARQIDRGADFEAALASPGEVIRRGLAVDSGAVSKAKRAKPDKAASRKRVQTLEAALEALDLRHAGELAEIDARAAELATRRQVLTAEQERERAKAVKALKAARAAG